VIDILFVISTTGVKPNDVDPECGRRMGKILGFLLICVGSIEYRVEGNSAAFFKRR
jgi:hypothetical protein